MEIKLKMPKQELFATQVDLLRRSITRELALAHMAGMIVVALVLWKEVSWHLMAGWCVTQLLVLLAREASINKLTLVPETVRKPRWDYRKMQAGNIVTGLLWALGMCYVASVASLQTQYMSDGYCLYFRCGHGSGGDYSLLLCGLCARHH